MRRKGDDAGQTGPVRRVGILGLLVLLVGAGAGWGAGGEQEQGSSILLRFDFQTPGARSLGMGGAFLGLADDATAAYTNPAGLTNLKVGGREAALEVRTRSIVENNPSEGRLFGDPTRVGLDTVDGIVRTEDTGETRGLSFLSAGFVLPGGATLAVYRHELVRYHLESSSQGFFYGEGVFCDPEGCLLGLGRTPASRWSGDVAVTNLGASGAYELAAGEGSLAVGVGLSLHQLDLTSRTGLYLSNPPTCAFDEEGVLRCDSVVDRQPDGFLGPSLFLPDSLAMIEEEVGDDQDLALSIGLLWKVGKRERWRLGAVYRQGSRFSTERVTRDAAQREVDRKTGTFTIPDTYGAGIAYSTRGGKTKLAFDYNRIRYSQRYDETVRNVSDDLLAFFLDLSGRDFELKDADQLHLGFEQVFPIIDPQIIGTVRAGVWREPFHDPAYVGSDEDIRQFLDSAFPERTGSLYHYTAGLGFVLRENIQVDVAGDFSDRNDIVSLSLVTFF